MHCPATFTHLVQQSETKQTPTPFATKKTEAITLPADLIDLAFRSLRLNVSTLSIVLFESELRVMETRVAFIAHTITLL